MKPKATRRAAKPAAEPAKPEAARAGVPIAGIGASAGGIAALRGLFGAMPAASGMAFVVILHLPAEHESNLAQVLQQVTPIPVTQVVAATKVEPNHVYVIPPSKHLVMTDGTIDLRDPDGAQVRRAPIDLFFRTLAETHGRNAAAVILSGSGADGTLGAQRIKEQGGVVLAQSPHEAEFDAMPRNVIATELVDFVLRVAEMPEKLINYWRTADSVCLPADTAQPNAEEGTLREIFALLRARTSHDFSQYKRPTLLRRIGRRMQVNQVTDLPAYLAELRAHPDEVQALLRDLLISVTNFFRDPPAWHSLAAALPSLLANKEPGEQLRAWVAGCATGEEAYSVAMLLYEHASTLAIPPNIQVFATDIDVEAINIARQGLYPETIATDVSPERLERFFVPEQGRYRIKKEIRDMVLFAPHNLLRDPPFSRLNLITCRNLLIYLNRDIQEQVLQLFHFVLRPAGVLMLGTSESTDGVPDLFVPLDKAQRLFECHMAPRPTTTFVPGLPLVGPPQRPTARRAPGETGNQSFAELHSQLLAEYTPPSVIVNEEHEIVNVSRGAGSFLQFIEGQPSHNLLKLVHPDLRLDLRSALFAANQQPSGAEQRRVRVDINGSSRLIELIVRPLSGPEWARGYLMVVFHDLGDASDIEYTSATSAEPVVRQLESELQHTKQQLRTTIEQYETATEEYKAANEELQAINEELRAATEELETSKEELQSLNEELTTVNQELKHKVDEVSLSNNDLLNLMASSDIGTIFVDRAIQLTRYTPSAQAIFNLIASDVNRPLAHITHKLGYQHLAQDAARVLETLDKAEREVASSDGRSYLARLLPYRTAEGVIDGVILTFIDITERKRAEEALQGSEYRLRLLLESVEDYAIFTLNLAGQIDSWNLGAERILGYTESEVLGRNSAIIFTPEDRRAHAPENEIQTALLQGRAADERWHIRKDGSRFYASGVLSRLDDPQGTPIGFVKIMRDLTQQKLADEALQRAHDELEQRVVERTHELADANRDLQTEITERKSAQQERLEVLRRVVTAQEEERRRIARELHDQLGQQLSALQLGLAQISEPAKLPKLQTSVAQLQQIAAQLDSDVNRLATELRPSLLDDLGLQEALQQLVRGWDERYGIAAELQVHGLGAKRLPPELEIVVYRLVQEALTNVLKHAAAQHVSIVITRRAGELRAVIEDDGKGFAPATFQDKADVPRLGLLGMRERAALASGTLAIESAPGRGTTVLFWLPLAER